MKNILIVGFGNIGKHIYDELKSYSMSIYDPYIEEYKNLNGTYDIAFICVPTEKL